MISNKEKIFENYIAAYLTGKHHYQTLSAANCSDKEFHFIAAHLLSFITETQLVKYDKLKENCGSDAGREYLKHSKPNCNANQLPESILP